MIDPNQQDPNAAAGTNNQDPLRTALMSILGQGSSQPSPSIQVNANGVSAATNPPPARTQPGDPDTDLVSHRYFVADALRRRGWNEDAINQVIGNVSLSYNTDTDRRPNAPEGVFAAPPPWNPNMPPSIQVNTHARPQHTESDANVYEHEAHHAIDYLNGGYDQNYGPGWQRFLATMPLLGGLFRQQAPIFRDLVHLHDWAQQTGNSRLDDVLTRLSAAAAEIGQSDALHINHVLSVVIPQDQFPDWYRQKYFSYLGPQGRLLRETDQRYSGVPPDLLDNPAPSP